MRDWNALFDIVEKEGFTVCSLPMRDWNTYKDTVDAYDDKVCSLPMRDWNKELKLKAYSDPFSL